MTRFALFLLMLSGGAFAATPALMPLPAKMETTGGALTITGDFTAVPVGYTDPRLEAALKRFTARLSRQTGIPMIAPKPSDPAKATLRVECAAAGAPYPTLGEDESYTLDVTAGGARLRAAIIDGALHGLETFAQLVTLGPNGFQAPASHIEDQPRFAWRGLMIDVSRHWMPVPVIERNLDAMAAVKMNVFHWHLSDDQGFRVESGHYPRLQEMGSDGNYYTQGQIRHIVEYARDRGIRVIPEFDVPGHTTSWFPGYPELASAPGPYSIGRTWGIFDPTLDPSREETYQFLDNFIGEMVQLFPDPFFHIGGDEVNGRQWTQSQKIQDWARQNNLKDNHAIQAYFNQRLLKIVEKYGKTMVGWDEILHPDLPMASVIQSWRGQNGLADAVKAGHRAILSWGYYLDHMQPASYHYGIEPLAGPAADLTPEQAARVMGGEACMWDEYASAETVDSRIWPRAAAVAERFWSRREVIDPTEMYPRLEAVSRQLDWTGVQHRAGYQAMLDRLSGGRPSRELRVLADAVEAQGLGPRARAQKYTSLTPLNRLADAARPESENVRQMQLAAARVVANPAGALADVKRLREQFAEWAANDAPFQDLAEGNALLAELKPLSKDLAAVGAAGLEALDYLTTGKAVPPDWVSARSQALARLLPQQGPRRGSQRQAAPAVNAEVTLAAARPVKLLVDEVARKAR
jgi:hexosaminidase